MRLEGISVGLKPRNLWVGCYWTTGPRYLVLYICLVPMVAIKMAFRKQEQHPNWPACGLCLRVSLGEYLCQRCGVRMCSDCVGPHTVNGKGLVVCVPRQEQP